MTTLEITTNPPTTVHEFALSMRALGVVIECRCPACVVPPVVAAQRAGDADYDWCIERGLGGEQAAIAYHLAYQRLARVPGGCGPVCGCDLCRVEFSPSVLVR